MKLPMLLHLGGEVRQDFRYAIQQNHQGLIERNKGGPKNVTGYQQGTRQSSTVN